MTEGCEKAEKYQTSLWLQLGVKMLVNIKLVFVYGVNKK